MTSEPLVRSAQTIHLSCVKIGTICKWTEMSFHESRNLGVPSGASKTISELMVHLAQTMHLSCTNTNTISKQKRSEIPHEPRHQGVPSGASKMFLILWYVQRKPCTYLASRLALYVRKAETIFHLSLVTYWYHRVHPKGFMSLWYVQRKPCTYLALTLTLPPNGKK